jgi:hypothetical protein
MSSDRSAPDGQVPPPVAEPQAPRPGDLVVTREARSAVRYSVREVPGEPQITLASRDETLRLARGFARDRGVDLWYSEGGETRRLDTRRAAGARR